MVDHLLATLVGLRTVSAVLALVLVGLAGRAWLRSREPRMLKLGIGFGLLLVSLAIEAFSFQVLFAGDLLVAHIIEAATQLVAFGVLIWALF